MTPRLIWRTLDDGVVALEGVLDEQSNLSSLASALPATGASLDLAGVKRINSIGIREWREFLRAVAGRPITLLRCPPVFVDQLNTIANFGGHAEVSSVLAPFECLRCGEQQLVLLEVFAGDLDPLERMPEAPRCPSCQEAMQLDGEPTGYFRFLKLVAMKK